MAHLTRGQITLGKTASLLGIIQGITWFIMSLLCIIEFAIDETPAQEEPSTVMDRFNYRVYYIYLYKDAVRPDDTVVTPITFDVFMCIYIVLDTIWVVTSMFQINVLKKNSVNVPVLFKDWSLITWLISFVDFIFIVLIGVDFNRECQGTAYEEQCTDTMIPVLVIVARGFILWLVNVIVAWRLHATAKVLRTESAHDYKGTFGGILPIYRPVSYIPRATVSTTPSLYSQQLTAVNREKNMWNVNLRTAMDNRTPPVSPVSPFEKSAAHFFGKQ